jgi:hypothetical protein
VKFPELLELPRILGKLTSEFFRAARFDIARHGIQAQFGEKMSMRARPEVRDILIAKKLRHWSLVARHPDTDHTHSASQARKNFWRLYARYPSIAQRLGLTAASLYR